MSTSKPYNVRLGNQHFSLNEKLSHIWNNSFSKDMPVMWKENTDAQYVLNAYVAASYYTSYMTKVDKYMTSAFRRIHKEHERIHIDAIQMICTLGNALLNLQQMSSQQAVHMHFPCPSLVVQENVSS